MPLVHHRAELAPGMLKMGLFPVFCHPVSYCEVLPAPFVTPAFLSPRYKTYRKIHSVHGLSLFSNNIVIHLSSSLDVCRCTWMHSRAVLRCVLLSPLQIMIKMNLFYILGRLQGHRSQLCQTWLRRYWIILCFEHMLWMPCRYNTFDGRLLWFDGVEGKRGLTLTVSFLLLLLLFFFFCVCVCVGGGGVCVCVCVCVCVWAGGGGVKLFHCIVRTGVHGILCA